MAQLSDEQKSMRLNPFDGDRGYPGDRVLRDGLVTTKKEHVCNECGHAIVVGERARRQVCIFGGNIETYYWHVWCLAKAYDELVGIDKIFDEMPKPVHEFDADYDLDFLILKNKTLTELLTLQQMVMEAIQEKIKDKT